MTTTIIYAHPYEKSFNHAILQRVEALLQAKGENYRVTDLWPTASIRCTAKKNLPCSAKGSRLIPSSFGLLFTNRSGNIIYFCHAFCHLPHFL